VAKREPEHFWSIAVQDLRTSTIRARAVRLGRRDLWLLYLELLFALKENGNALPADPAAVADEVAFFSPEEIEQLLPLLAPAANKRGGILIQGDTLSNPRIDEDNRERAAFAHVASGMGVKRAATAERGPDGRMLPKAQRSSSGKPAKGQPASSEAATRVVDQTETNGRAVENQPAPSDAPAVASSAGPALDQNSSIPSPFPHRSTEGMDPRMNQISDDPPARSAAAARAEGKGGAGGKGKEPTEAIVDGRLVTARPPASPPPSGVETPAPGQPVVSEGVEYDPADPDERRLAYDVLAIHRDLDPETRSITTAVDVLMAVTATPGKDGQPGKAMDSIFGAPRKWVKQSIRSCAKFREDHGLAAYVPEEPTDAPA
jgi:hypothetical protein